MKVNPDLDFIKYMKSAGGDTLKKCYQCATCSVVCPLSGDKKPFPRKEMIWAQWGLKDKLIADADVMLCHQCGDCSTYCPRGAKPGDVLGAIRAAVYTHYGWPRGLAKMVSDPKNLPMTIGLPAVIVLVLWFLSGGMHIPSAQAFAEYGYGHFFGHWDWRYLTKNVFFIDIIFVPAAILAIYASYRGVKTMWKGMSEHYNVTTQYRPSFNQFIKEFLWPSIKETVAHSRFKECTTHYDRVKGHLPLLLSFLALLIVTIYSAFTQDILGIFWPELHGPISMWNPIKILANVGAIALIVGVAILWANRSGKEAEDGAKGSYFDWFLIYLIMVVGVTGLAAEVIRLLTIPSLGYFLYYLHLVSVLMLFLYMPYTKLAHMVYRTFAMAFERYRESSFVVTE